MDKEIFYDLFQKQFKAEKEYIKSMDNNELLIHLDYLEMLDMENKAKIIACKDELRDRSRPSE